MKEAVFLYRCRLCGAIEDSVGCGQKSALHHLIMTELGESSGGISTHMLGIHHCQGYKGVSNLGVTDLIGIEMRGSDDSA